MSDLKDNARTFREAVCVEVPRIFDSCSDKDCLEDLEVRFSAEANEIITNSAYVKCKSAEVTNVYFAVEPVPFNKGFYSIDITYNFELLFEAYCNSSSVPALVSGTAQFCKKVILYGSDGCVKRFTSKLPETIKKKGCDCPVLPTVVVEVAQPVVLDTKVVRRNGCSDCPCDVCVSDSAPFSKKVCVTLGLFSIVQIQRPVSLVIPAYDYCVPQKECTSSDDSPCELFEKIDFPIEQFFPPSLDCQED